MSLKLFIFWWLLPASVAWVCHPPSSLTSNNDATRRRPNRSTRLFVRPEDFSAGKIGIPLPFRGFPMPEPTYEEGPSELDAIIEAERMEAEAIAAEDASKAAEEAKKKAEDAVAAAEKAKADQEAAERAAKEAAAEKEKALAAERAEKEAEAAAKKQAEEAKKEAEAAAKKAIEEAKKEAEEARKAAEEARKEAEAARKAAAEAKKEAEVAAKKAAEEARKEAQEAAAKVADEAKKEAEAAVEKAAEEAKKKVEAEAAEQEKAAAEKEVESTEVPRTPVPVPAVESLPPPIVTPTTVEAIPAMAAAAPSVLDDFLAKTPLPLLIVPLAALAAGRAILSGRDEIKNQIEAEIELAQQRRERELSSSNNVVLVRLAGWSYELRPLCFSLTLHCHFDCFCF
jgi:hypothetical protein